MNKVVHFLLTLLIMFAVSIAPAQALLKGGTWQELNSTTGAVNGTAPLADGATIPLYQGSMLLDPTKTYDIEFTAMPRDFSADASSTSMRAVNSTDTEGDLFTDPPSIAWENQEPPTMSLVWADAATPDTPLSPQPILNQTFCAQNLAGRQLVAWAQVEDETNVPALWLYTRTGVPNNAVIPLLSPKVTLNIKPAVSDPVSVSGDHIDANFAASKVKAGESITLTVSTKACNGDVAPNAAFVIRREDAINRQGVVNNANPVRVGDTELTTTQTEYHGVTDGQGNATVVVTQEQGPGVKTRLIVSSQSYPTLTDNVDVIFTTITSPDSDKANMYGHMLENATATLNGTTYTFTRPKLAAETSGNGGTVVDTNETWAQFTGSGADNHCDILPDAEQLVALRHEHSALATYTGWPVTGDAEYWSSTKDQINDYHAAVHMNSASVVRAANSDTLLVSCVDKAQPAAHPQITLSPEGPYTRQGEKHIAGSGDGIVSAVVIDGESLNDTATKIGELTGEDGSKIINVTRPDTHGTKVAITAALYDNASATASIDTVFTVVTSPDSDKAKMWGHMPETVAAANGEVFKRPLLSAEIASGITHGSNTENNETWGSVNFEVAKDACGAGFVPSLADLQSLYDAWPGGAMNTQQGWPLDGKNYQDSTADLSRSTENRYVKAINLRDGGIGSLLWDEKLYFVCLQNAHPVATQITLTSPQYNDSDGFAKAKVGETIPVTITTLDAQGKPVADTPVIFTRGDSIGRANQEVNGSQAAAIQINHSDARNSGVEYYTATGADGMLTLDISQDGGAGFKTPLMASIEHSNAATTAPLPVIFTVVTSPDTPKASYWGHMAETQTDSSGVAYKRPLLASEFSATPGKTLTIANGYYDKGETWGMITVDKAWNGVSGGCGRDYLPSVSNLQTLYNTWPDNAMRSRNGWPMTSSGNNNVSRYWWAGDSVVSSDGAQSLYAAVNLFNDGNDIKTTTSTSTYYMQTCLVSPRRCQPDADAGRPG